MSKLSGFRRKLDPKKVWLAQQVAEEKIKIARQVVIEQAKKDAQFAADVLKAVGENLPKEIKEACEASVKEKTLTETMTEDAKTNPAVKRLMEETKGLVAKWDKTGLLEGLKSDIDKTNMAVLIESEPKQIIDPCCGGHCGCAEENLVPVQTDGGGTILVHETETLEYPKDGPDSAWEPPPPGVLDGPLPPEAQKLVDEHLKKV